MKKKQAIEQSPVFTDGAKLAEGVPPVLWTMCQNCYGTGTIFAGIALRVGNSRVCPVCKGKTKVPA